MSREYKTRDKKFHKMTRNGLIERNAVTGAEENISSREQDFNIQAELLDGRNMTTVRGKTENTNIQTRHNEPVNKQRQIQNFQTQQQMTEMKQHTQAVTGEGSSPVSGSTEVLDYKQEPGNRTTDTVPIHKHESSAGGKTTEVVKPSEYLHDMRNHEAPSVTPKKTDGAEHRGRLQFTEEIAVAHDNKTSETHASANSPQSDKLQFAKNSNFKQHKQGGKEQKNKRNLQKGNKYHQRFTPEAASKEKPSVLEYRQSEQASKNAQPNERSEVALDETLKTHNTHDVPKTAQSDKVQFIKDEELNQFEKYTHTRLKNKGNQQHFTPEIAKPQTDKPSDTASDKSRLQTDAKPSKLQKKLGKLKFDADGLNGNKPDKFKQKKTGKNKTLSDTAPQTTKKPDKVSKLEFTDDEKTSPADKKLSLLQDKADKCNSKLEKARDKLPSKKRSKEVRSFDERKGKAKGKIQFEKEILPAGTRKTSMPVEIAKTGAEGIRRSATGRLHQKVSEVEHENVGIQAGHRVEQAAEGAYRGGKRITRSSFRYVKNKPYRTVAKLEKQAVKANIRLSYRKALSENPQLKSNVFSRFMQKRKIKQQYAKTAHDAKRLGKTAVKTADMSVRATKVVTRAIKRHPATAALILIILLLSFLILSLLSSFGSMAGAGLPAIIASSYLAGDSELDTAELSYTEWETDLLMKIDNIEPDYPGYDEYRYQVDNIGHNPYELIAYLTATYQNFQYADIEPILQEIFDEQYSLSITPSVETRYADPTDANNDGDYEPYDWHVLTVSLTAQSFTDVVLSRMNDEQIGIYSLLMQTKGNRQYVDSPFDFNWLANVTSYYGYRIHPITGGKDYHKAVDIAVPVGTEIHAGYDGTVTFAGYNGGYGYVVVIENDKGVVSKYAHCDSLLVSAGQDVKRGDTIALSGNSGNSTGPHLHFEVIRNGQYLNPLYFAVTNDSGGLTTPVYGYPGEPMGDGSYAALIEEAEKYLGMPYVWGGSSPATSFDCSGFITFVLNQSGVASFDRTTAQGIYNMTTPIPTSDAQPGDLVFFHSTYSTANTVTHVGIYVGNGYMVHAGDPIQYTSINTSYWQSHLYAFGRLN